MHSLLFYKVCRAVRALCPLVVPRSIGIELPRTTQDEWDNKVCDTSPSQWTAEEWVHAIQMLSAHFAAATELLWEFFRFCDGHQLALQLAGDQSTLVAKLKRWRSAASGPTTSVSKRRKVIEEDDDDEDDDDDTNDAGVVGATISRSIAVLLQILLVSGLV
jgi:hypothetical protein